MKTVIFSALKAGYRHIDAAFLYGNEKDIGEALEESMKKLNIQREDIFITTKCWCTHLRPEYVRKCCQMSLSDLRLPYVDLYLIHWPVAFQHSDVSFPRASNGHDFLLDDVPLLDTWKAMENLVDDGMVRAIGLSNFNRRQIDTIMNGARIKPVNLQIEINANFPNTKLVEYAQASGLTVTAYAPLGSPSAAVWKDVIQGDKTNLLTASWVREIAERHNKTSAQILLRYLLQRNIIVIPKSSNPKRIVENSKIFDFILTDDEMQVLNTSGLNERQFKFPGMRPSKEYPFNDEF
ncbi:hypothetical protein CRM22_002509 [Opisthorchis felineus]|nr:hypothetical protein CRM22_002509 [Opisthorchis felineus]